MYSFWKMDNRESDVALTLAEFVLNSSRPPTPPSHLLCEAPSDCPALPACGGLLTPFAVVQAWCSDGTLWKCYREHKVCLSVDIFLSILFFLLQW